MILKKLLFPVTLLVSFVAAAQTVPVISPSPALPASSALSVGKGDTLRAMNNLFARRRQSGLTWMLVTAGGLGLLARAAANPDTRTVNGVIVSSEPNTGAMAVIAVGLVGVPALLGVGKLVRFSHGKQQAAEQTIRSGQRLPRYVSRRLRRKYFI